MSAFNRKSGGGKHKGKKEKGSGGGGSESGGGAGIEEMATTSKSDIAQAPLATASTKSSRKQRPNSGTDILSINRLSASAFESLNGIYLIE